MYSSVIPWIGWRVAPLFLMISMISSGVAMASPPGFPREIELEPGFVSLFDGQSLDQWEADAEHWRVEKGVLIGEIPAGEVLPKNNWIIWRAGELQDFDLRLKFKLSGSSAANSGIQIRAQAESTNHVSGYQADLDQGATWLGRIYDEHGRALLVERGSRVSIDAGGKRFTETFAPPKPYAVLFRKNDWNDYRIVAVGSRICVYVNGTLFSELIDEQMGACDRQGALAMQLHAGPATRIEFRDIRVESLSPDDTRLGPIAAKSVMPSEAILKRDGNDPVSKVGVFPRSDLGEELNMGFESGDLSDWTALGDAFQGQPVNASGISDRWPQQVSAKQGQHFIAGFEHVRDSGKGSLTSKSFKVTHRYAGFLIAGGDSKSTRMEIVLPATDERKEEVIFFASGKKTEQMQRTIVDLQKWRGKRIAVRLIDESSGSWGHLNFDDFRFLDQVPENVKTGVKLRSIHSPMLQHLVANKLPKMLANKRPTQRSDEANMPPVAVSPIATLNKMFVPKGFSVDLIAAEPQLHQPMAFTFDAKGRLWVVEGHSYPQKRPKGKGLDRILIFADENGDGEYEGRKVFAEGLNLVSGLQVGHGGVWVGAAPDLLFIPDQDGDDVPDGAPQVLLTGFGFTDTHETLNSFLWGPDGWLYGNQGVFNTSHIGKPNQSQEERVKLASGVWRYHPTRHEFEIFAHGGSNQWGLDYDQFGQLFMTHCRSYHGKGPTTHVVQGGHYWRQTTGGYASMIHNKPLAGMPWMKNFMLASARYGHGEGGAGKPGSKAVYGGHSHVGTMIYQGDNWPDRYRHHLFTHNLHGHQMNHQVNVREAGGYRTWHAGDDVLLCTDEQYVAVDLQYGPDGAVYLSDWYDPRHCHNPMLEQWDRSNGRIYRMKFDASYKPTLVDYSTATLDELINAQSHRNAWHARMARLVISERAADGLVSSQAISRLVEMATHSEEISLRLRALWSLYVIDAFHADLFSQLLQDDHEVVRAWAVRLAVEFLPQESLANPLLALAKSESSLLVRRNLASAIQRVPRAIAWQLSETLADQIENGADQELTLLLWYGLAERMKEDLSRALSIAESTPILPLRDYLHWYAAKTSDEGRDAIMQKLASSQPADQQRLLVLLDAGVGGTRGIRKPDAWDEIASKLYESPANSRAAERLGAAFGDPMLFTRMRRILSDADSGTMARLHALEVLKWDDSTENLPVMLQSLDTDALALPAIIALKRYNAPAVATELVARLPQWNGARGNAAMETLCSRTGWSKALLDAIAAGDVEIDRVTAFHARQMSNLGDDALTDRLTKQWGRLNQSSAERLAEIKKLVAAYKAAPLWAYDLNAGKQHFQKHCAACHQPDDPSTRLAPKLEGTGSKGIEYLAENIIDPNAVIGKDFQARMILTGEGRVVTGLVVDETASAVTVATGTSTETVGKQDIERMSVSPNSFMPEGLLQSLSDRERIELLKYLMNHFRAE